MERRGSSVKPSSLAMVCVVLGLLMGAHQSMASFPSCYKSCFVLCVIKPGETAFKCAFQCLKDCLVHSASPSPASALSVDTDYFCKLGCSTSLCTNLSTKTNPGEKEVGGCVESCSGMCSNH
ncbi:thionin-like protein 2 [Punica granatum]|uniref:Thionin-like protein 2 n=1 Tax=Punica granatum TaxID=22663 RepID=A0A6P8CEJ2_PUNGR|nr:thionin-like protein 2 [Punica granatum]XP_031382417.1 thionin-like protein 2 [Punica granatum]